MRVTEKQVKERKAALKAAGVRYDDIARLANVSWTMVWMWIHGQRTSANVEAAYLRLTGQRAA